MYLAGHCWLHYSAEVPSVGFRCGFAPQVFPCVGILEALYRAAAEYAHEVSRTCWNAKRESFRAQVDESWTSHGGRFPFRLLREQQQPPVLDMRI